MIKPTHNSLNKAEQLLRKYNVPAPRYTSYPTVPYWEKAPNPEAWLDSLNQEIAQAHQRQEGMAIYVHIPFCESLCTYCGCNTRITQNHDIGLPYVQWVLKEFELYRSALSWPSSLELSELHLGGGTPTFLTVQELDRLLSGITKQIPISKTRRFSVEVDPRVTHADQLKLLADYGFQRISLGVQDFDPRVQDIVNRKQSVEQVAYLINTARELGYNSVNFDLIYGLPLQTEEGIKQTFEHVLRLRPDRIAYYAYAHVPWIKPAHRRYSEQDLPVGEKKRRLYEIGRNMLENAGYEEIGLDHFALKHDPLWQALQTGQLHRNFMGYIEKQSRPILGLGVSAISDSGDAFVQNEKVLEKYRGRLEQNEWPYFRGHVLNEEDKIIRHHIHNIMTRLETSWQDPAMYTPFLDEATTRLSELIQDGLCHIEGKSLRVLNEGRPFIRNIAMAFDARLARKAPETRLFSQSI